MSTVFRDGHIAVQDIDKESKRRALRMVSIAWGFGTVWFVTVFGAPLTGFATVILKADSVWLGIFGALPALSQLLQLPGSYLSERFNRRKFQFIAACLIHRLMWFPIAFVPFYIEGTNARLVVFGILLAVSFSLGQIATPPWQSWMNDLIARRIRGRFFAQRQSLAELVNIVALLLTSWYLDHHKDTLGFAVAFSIAALFGSIDIVLFMLVPEVPAKKSDQQPTFMSTIFVPLRDKKFRPFLLFTIEWAFAIGVAAPFFNLYFLNYLEVSYGFIALSFNVVSSITAILVYRAWGRTIDSLGPRSVFRMCGRVIAFVPAIWILCTKDFLWIFPINAVICALFWSGIGLAHFNLLLEVSPSHRKSSYFACFAIVSGLVATIAPVIGGLILKYTQWMSFDILGFHFFNLHFLFILTSVLRWTSLRHLGDLDGAKGDDLKHTFALFRDNALGQFGSLFNFFGHPAAVPVSVKGAEAGEGEK